MGYGPVLVGTDGFIQGEEFTLRYGSTVTVGRSRRCDISLQSCKAWLDLDPEQRNAEQDFQTVSRKHVRISYYDPGNIEIEDLSSNGTFVNGQRTHRVVISDLREHSYEIRLGTREKFRLEWRAPGQAAEPGPAHPDDHDRSV